MFTVDDVVGPDNEPIAHIMTKNNNKAVFMLIVEHSMVDLFEQCIFFPN